VEKCAGEWPACNKSSREREGQAFSRAAVLLKSVVASVREFLFPAALRLYNPMFVFPSCSFASAVGDCGLCLVR